MPTFKLTNAYLAGPPVTGRYDVRSLLAAGDVDGNLYKNLLYAYKLRIEADKANLGAVFLGKSTVTPTNFSQRIEADESSEESSSLQSFAVDDYLCVSPIQAAPGAPTVANGAGPLTAPGAPTVTNGAAGTNLLQAGTYKWRVTFVTANGETEGGTVSATKTIDPATELPPALSAIPLGAAGTTSRNIYRTLVGGSVYKLSGTIADNTTQTYTDNIPDASLTTTAPTVNTTATNLLSAGVYHWKITFVTADGETNAGTASAAKTIDPANELPPALSAIPTSAVAGITVTARKIYRTAVGGTVYKFVATIADNSTTTYTDNIPDASLGATAPTTNSSVPMKVNILWESPYPLEMTA